MCSIAFLSWFRSLAEGGSWVWLWLLFFGALINAIREHGELWGEVKHTTGTPKRVAIGRIAFDWSLVLISLIAALASEWSSDTAAQKIADTNKRAADAYRLAGEANKEAAKGNERAELLASNNLVLRSNVVELERKTLPANQPWLNTWAVVNIKVKGTNRVEVPPWGGPRVAMLLLCGSQLQATVGVSDGFPTLDAKTFEHAFAIIPPEDARWYSMLFRIEAAPFSAKTSKVAGELEAVNFLSVWLKFVPLDAEILSGDATVIVNDTIRKPFTIPPQKAFKPLILTNDPSYLDAFRVIAVFGTNELPVNPGPEVR